MGEDNGNTYDWPIECGRIYPEYLIQGEYVPRNAPDRTDINGLQEVALRVNDGYMIHSFDGFTADVQVDQMSEQAQRFVDSLRQYASMQHHDYFTRTSDGRQFFYLDEAVFADERDTTIADVSTPELDEFIAGLRVNGAD